MLDISKVKLGKLPVAPNHRAPKLSNFMKAELLPPVPASADWGSKVAAWQMDGNDTAGDCTCAGAEHALVGWSTYNGTPIVTPEAQVLSLYETLSGYVPGQPATDTGLSELFLLNYWQATGVFGHKIDAFAGLDIADVDQIKLAISLFGGIYLGIALPKSAQAQTGPGLIWDAAPGANGVAGSWGGHCVWVIGFDANGLTVVTWGATQRMSWAFFLAYVDEAYALISPDFMTAQGIDPALIDLAQLQAYLADIAIQTPETSGAVTQVVNGQAPFGAPGLLLSPNLILCGPGIAATGAVSLTPIGFHVAQNTMTAAAAFADCSLGLLSASQPSPWYFGYLPNWGGGSAMVVGADVGDWFAEQTFTAPISGLATTTAISNGTGAMLYAAQTTDDLVALGVMVSPTHAYIFTDTDIAAIEAAILQFTATAPAVSRLYYVMLGRPPDAPGLAYWSGVYAAQGIAPVVAGFLQSPEFNGLNSGYGTNPTAFVTYLYASALGRTPEQAGVTYWVGQIVSQAQTYSQVIVSISQSDEAIGFLSSLPTGQS
jgi:hypothetical protein